MKDILVDTDGFNQYYEELNRLKRIICTCETLIKKLNLRVEYSKEGDEFDGTKMESYDDYEMLQPLSLQL